MRYRPAAVLLAALLPAAATAGEWTYWRGPEMNGVAPDAAGLPESWDPATGENVAWESPVGGRAAPIAMNGRLYLNCRTTDDVADPATVIHARQQTVCFDAATGEVVWRDVFNVAKTDIPAPRVGWASPVGDPETGNVYVHTVDGLLICYDGASGDRLWQLDFYEELGKISGYGGRTVTPIIDEDRLIVSFLELNWGDGAKPPPKQTFYAFNKFDGTILWRSQPGGKALDTIYTNPAIGEIGGVRQLVSGNTDGGACGIDARTGETLWTFRMSKRGLNASPVISGETVIISHGEDNIDTVAKGLGRVQAIDATLRGDITETGSLWRIDGIKAGYTAATLLAEMNLVLIVSDIGGMHAIDVGSGEELWKFQIGTVGKGSPVYADGKLYVPETNGRLWILKPSREGVEVLDDDVVEGTSVVGPDEVYASPAVAYGHVYFVARDRTFCLGDGDFEGLGAGGSFPSYEETAATYDRVRPDNGPLPWSYDFEDLKPPVGVPAPWVNAFLKVKPTAGVKGAEGQVLKSSPGPGKPSFDVFLGDSTMSDYVIAADVMVEGRRRLSTVGVTNQKYTLMLKANQNKLDVVTWQAHLRLGCSERFRVRPGKWYRMKLDVELVEDGTDDGGAVVRGKVWPRDEDEPEEWSITCTDPHPNTQGSPGLYTYRLADSYIDNVTVTADED